jgi:CheY-like chemotaxis protein
MNSDLILPAGAARPSAGPRVLVVDDEVDLVGLLGFELGRRGYDIVAANSGLAALNLARRCLPDLIILDLMMEGLDGFAVCDLLRRQPSTADIPILILTALGGPEVRQRACFAGAVDVIQKPFSPEDLAARMERALEASRQRHVALLAGDESQASGYELWLNI